jgi:hypothetical protein
MDTLIIACDDCRMQHTPVCEGCVVSFICDRDPGDVLVVDRAEVRAFQLLGRSGLLPPLRHRRSPPPAARAKN